MALIRNFPVPSDRMAIISTLLNIEDAVVLEYGPEGTTHFSMNFFNKLGQDYPNRLFTTGVDDSDIVMGSTENLERGILELDALYSPKAIFVLTSSVTSIIGTDIAGICDSLQSKVQSRLITAQACEKYTCSWPSCLCSLLLSSKTNAIIFWVLRRCITEQNPIFAK